MKLAHHLDCIDYLGDTYGVRVWRQLCVPLKHDPATAWSPSGDPQSIPLSESMLESNARLSQAVADYETYRGNELSEDHTELRFLLLGKTDFTTACK